MERERNGQWAIVLGVVTVISMILAWMTFQPTVKVDGITHVIGRPVSDKASTYLHHVSESEVVEVDVTQFKVASEQSKEIMVVYRGKQWRVPVQFKAPAIEDIVTTTEHAQMFVVGGDYRAVFGIPSEHQPFATYTPASDQLKPGLQHVTVSLYGQTMTQLLNVHDGDNSMGELVKMYQLDTDLQHVIQQFAEKENVSIDAMSVSYQNLVTKEEAHVNANTPRVAASTYKLPLGLAVEDKLSDLGYKWEDVLEVYPYVDAYETRVFEDEFSTQVSISDLLAESIVHSSNVASWTLMKHFGGAERLYAQSFHKYGVQQDAAETTIDYETNESTTGYFLQVLTYLWEHQAQYPKVVEHLKNASPNEFYEALLPEVDIWHKYGDLDGEYNDVAIVFEKQPYSVAVFTQDLTMYQFSRLAFLINEWHRVNEKHVSKES